MNRILSYLTLLRSINWSDDMIPNFIYRLPHVVMTLEVTELTIWGVVSFCLNKIRSKSFWSTVVDGGNPLT
jgi:hypothetical protein